MNPWWKPLTRLFVGVTLLFVTACSDPRIVHVATDPHHPPLSYLDDHDHLVGFEVDLMQAIAQKKGWTIVWHQVPQDGLFAGVDWTGILAGLRWHAYDLAISGLAATADLRLTWAISQPYLQTGPELVVPASSTITDLSDLSKQPFGTVRQPELDQVLLRYRVTDETQQNYGQLSLALADLSEGRIAGVVAPREAVAYARKENELLRTTTKPVQRLSDDFPLAVFARPEDQSRIQAVNDALEKLRTDGTLDQLKRQWFLSP